MSLENLFGKKGTSFFSLSLPHFRPVGLFLRTSPASRGLHHRPARLPPSPFSSWAGPARLATAAAAPLPRASAAACSGPRVSAAPNLPRVPRPRPVKAKPPLRAHASHRRGSVSPRPASTKGSRDPLLHSLLPPHSSFALAKRSGSRNRRSENAEIRRARKTPSPSRLRLRLSPR